MADLARVRIWAEALIALHLDPSWTFAFDHARTRAGACHYGEKRITVSRHLAGRFEDDEIHQVLLHEVAHALAGSRAGHGPRWKATAAEPRLRGVAAALGAPSPRSLAPWVGACPAGHAHFRYRKPTRPLACGLCSKRFDRAHLIAWTKREVPSGAAASASARSAAGREGAA
ncbi:SprT-like domain-containing protein [Clavibacter tessellarius]|uniref:SprT-like domain-containing protein n=1 Tax=Clavibacter tessellarius TaxID=31965 RepID=UPI0032544283